jgi:predicted ATPase
MRRHEYKELPTNSPLAVALRTERMIDFEDLKAAYDRLPTRRRLVLVTEGGMEVQPQDVGVGIAQLVPVVVLAVSRLPLFAAIEHPELNLHPRLQAEMADVFLAGALSKSMRGRIFLIETHSEALTLRFFRRIRESTRGQTSHGIAVKPTDVGVWYVDRSSGIVTVKQILLDVQGEFVQPWPEDDSLFEQDFRERYA